MSAEGSSWQFSLVAPILILIVVPCVLLCKYAISVQRLEGSRGYRGNRQNQQRSNRNIPIQQTRTAQLNQQLAEQTNATNQSAQVQARDVMDSTVSVPSVFTIHREVIRSDPRPMRNFERTDDLPPSYDEAIIFGNPKST